MVTAVRSNAQPSGGTVDTQPVPPNSIPPQLAALLDQLTPAIAKFRGASSEEYVLLDKMSPGLGDAPQIRIASLGLGFSIESHHTVVIAFTNSSGGAAATYSVGPHFPFNLIQAQKVAINGGETVHNASGVADLLTSLRRHRGTLVQPLSPALCRVTLGAGVTGRASTKTFSGYDQFTVANGGGSITVDFYSQVKLAYTESTLVGALPLQNRTVYATYEVDTVGALAASGANQTTDQTKAFYNNSDAAHSAPSLTSWTVLSEYGFWSLPSNAQLYQELITNSYQVMEQRSLPLVATGPQALVYNIPQNIYLVSLHLLGADSTGALFPFGTLTKEQLSYNSGVINPWTTAMDMQRARQFRTYGADIQAIVGYTCWDGDAVAEDINQTDDSGWIDAYDANTPIFVADIASGLSVPATYSVTREAIVPGAVQVVG